MVSGPGLFALGHGEHCRLSFSQRGIFAEHPVLLLIRGVGLHRHAFLERSLERSDHGHVVVDLGDWENAMELLASAKKQREYMLNADGDLLLQEFMDAIKRCDAAQ